MSGLDVDQCRILEVAIIVTDLELNEIETYEKVIYQPPEVLAAMDTWCTEHHGKSGLTAAVAEGAPEDEVQRQVRALIDRHWRSGQKAILCGNSVGTDRKFIKHWWAEVAGRIHYRIVDVSSWKVIFQERFGVNVRKAGGHRALDDIRESIEELKTYLGFLDLERLSSKS